MAGGSSFTNLCLAMPMFIIPPEWYAGYMDLLNTCWRAVSILQKVSRTFFLSCHFLSSNFLSVLVMAVVGTIKYFSTSAGS